MGVGDMSVGGTGVGGSGVGGGAWSADADVPSVAVGWTATGDGAEAAAGSLSTRAQPETATAIKISTNPKSQCTFITILSSSRYGICSSRRLGGESGPEEGAWSIFAPITI
jgi:hypothetical protein